MSIQKDKIIFHGEECILLQEDTEYHFLILGRGVIPIGKKRNIHLTIQIRSFIKENFLKTMSKIQKWQEEKEFELKYNLKNK